MSEIEKFRAALNSDMLDQKSAYIDINKDKFKDEQSISSGIKVKRINKSASFNAIKDQVFDLFYPENDTYKTIQHLSRLFIASSYSVRPGRTPPRKEAIGYKKWRYQKCIRKHVF